MDDDKVQSNQTDDYTKKPYAKALQRFFSVDSETNMAQAVHSPPQFNHSLCSKEFIIKIAQLLTGITCAGFYSEGVKMMRDSITSLVFPNVVFSSFIIITSVIVLSYAVGHVMPDILMRMFNAIGMILYFVSATVSMCVWGEKVVDTPDLLRARKYLLIQAVLSYFNCLFYGFDIGMSIKKAVTFD